MARVSAFIFIAMVAGLTVSACIGPSEEENDVYREHLDGQWTIRRVATEGGSLVGPVDGTSPFLSIEGETLSGHTGCNGFSSTAAVGTDKSFSAGPLMSTLIGCDPDRTRQETAIHAALGRATHWTIAGETATLSHDGVTVLELGRLDTSLPDSHWFVQSINNGRGGVQSIAIDSRPTLSFSTDGTVTGSTGCNKLIATYRTEGDQIAIDRIGTTKKLCTMPEGIMEQERSMIIAIESTVVVAINGDTLTLRDKTGATQIVATRGHFP